jgi:predicted nuclease with RNAse H fold
MPDRKSTSSPNDQRLARHPGSARDGFGHGPTVAWVITSGIDLATEPAKTALATLSWRPGGASVVALDLGVDDEQVLEATTRAEVIGVDCPLGWPDDFVSFLVEHHDGHVVAPQDVAGISWRRRLAYRATDRAVHMACGVTPLSVAADRIGLTAMRAAGLLARLAKGKGGLPGRDALMTSLTTAAPWLDFGRHAELCRTSDDALDAVIAAMTARAKALGRTSRPDPQDAGRARRAGWIALPTHGLDALVDA